MAPARPRTKREQTLGLDRYCPATDLACGNGADRTMHPAEMLGEDWYLHGDWGFATPENPNDVQTGETSPPPIGHL
ncbi:DUF3079 domain-containing protein [Pseudomonas sp. NCHU5208]|uniref:DUF3079 domain-containing protein n=1 Tax=unclassified Pseudomonas TaxID=196821 RepID=UPI003F9C7CC7